MAKKDKLFSGAIALAIGGFITKVIGAFCYLEKYCVFLLKFCSFFLQKVCVYDKILIGYICKILCFKIY